MSKREVNKRTLSEIHKRLDDKAKIFYVAYRNGRLDLDSLNEDMRKRVIKLDKEEKGLKRNLSKRLDEIKIKNIDKALDNINNSFDEKESDEEQDTEPELSEKIVTKFDVFKTI